MSRALPLLLLLATSLAPAHAAGTAPRVMPALFVDLEFEPQEPDALQDIEVALNEAAKAIPQLKNHVVKFTMVHYAQLTPAMLAPGRFAFVVLSPQVTPWGRYFRERARDIGHAKAVLKESLSAGKTPVLGICGGHQLLALIFGGETDVIDPKYRGKALDTYPEGSAEENGTFDISPLAPDPLLEGVAQPGGTFEAVEMHHEEVTRITRPLLNLASSRISRIQMLRVAGKPVYGVQFHPEADEGAGRRILQNFLRLVVARR